MRIKKVSQVVPIVEEASIVDAYSTSTTNGYSCNYVNGLNTFSTTEQRIGTWIDGKPLYRKVIDFGALPNNTGKNVAHNIPNLKKVINMYGYSTNGSAFISPNYSTYSSLASYIYVSSTNVTVTTYTDRSAYTETYIILEYTKTTD